jgi:hypothetical protein
MATDVTQLTDYAWADIAKAAKQAMLSAALGGASLTINGRIIQRITIDDARKLYELATQMVESDLAGESGGGNVLVQFKRPQ